MGRQSRLPPIDVFFLVETAPALNDRESKSWDAYNLKVLTYKGLITNARMSYQSYLDINLEVVGRLTTLLDGM